MKNKIHKYLLLVVVAFCFLKVYAQGTWTQKADFPSQPRSNAVGFSIGNYGYVGTGYRWFNNINNYFNDFWKYDPSLNSWTQIATFPGTTKVALAGFSIDDSVAYVVAGASYPSSELWKYNPISNSWFKMADIPQVLTGSTGFSIGGYGYITVGSDTATSWFSYNLWAYDPSLNSWTQKAIFPGLGRSTAIGFSIGNYGYIGTGFNQNNQYVGDFWKYDAINNSWASIANFGGGGRGGAVVFVTDSFGYVGTGWKFPGGGQQDDLWQYDKYSYTWIQQANLTGPKRYYAASFSIGVKGYIATGMSGIISNNTDTFFNDTWEFTPGLIGIEENEKINAKIFPDPFHDFFRIEIPDKFKNIDFILYDASGRWIKSIRFSSEKKVINAEEFAAGIYYYQINYKSQIVSHGRLIKLKE